jgi:hypothetical protein
MKISSLIILSAMAAATTAESAHAEILTMTCEGYNVVFSPGSLTSHAPRKDRDYPITKVDVQNDRTIVSGITKYGKITAFFSNDGHSSIVWTNGKDVVLNQCVSQIALRTLQESRSEADEAAARAEVSPYDDSINHKQDATWKKALDKAARLSAMQNHGHADFKRTCYAEDQKAFCATVITYRSEDGDLTFIRAIHRGEDDSLFARDVCQFNKNETLRTCINFDTGYKSLWVPDDNGDWKQVNSAEQKDDEWRLR